MNNQPDLPNREVYVCDTMALVLWLEERKLPEAIRFIFSQIIKNNAKLVIPAMVLAEVGYLSEKRRIGLSLSDVSIWVENLVNVDIAPVSGTITRRAFIINDIPELHDRLIAATAVEINAPLLTNDPKIKASKSVKTIWSIPQNGQKKTRCLPDARAFSSV